MTENANNANRKPRRTPVQVAHARHAQAEVNLAKSANATLVAIVAAQTAIDKANAKVVKLEAEVKKAKQAAQDKLANLSTVIEARNVIEAAKQDKVTEMVNLIEYRQGQQDARDAKRNAVPAATPEEQAQAAITVVTNRLDVMSGLTDDEKNLINSLLGKAGISVAAA